MSSVGRGRRRSRGRSRPGRGGSGESLRRHRPGRRGRLPAGCVRRERRLLDPWPGARQTAVSGAAAGGVGAVWIRSLPGSAGTVVVSASHPVLGQASVGVRVR